MITDVTSFLYGIAFGLMLVGIGFWFAASKKGSP